MPKTNGHLTRQKIIEVSEWLFSEYGYDATSISQISKYSKINKATIYYHFDSKRSILKALYENIIIEINQRLNSNNSKDLTPSEQIREEIIYLRTKKNIVSILLMESLKSNDSDDSLFILARKEMSKNGFDEDKYTKSDIDKIQMHEFFTGFIPVLNFVALEEKYCAFFNCNEDYALDLFIENLTNTHIKTHLS